MITKEELEEKLNNAFKSLINEAKELLEDDVHERTTVCLLRQYIAEEFNEFNVDVEYNREWNEKTNRTNPKKPKGKLRYPDIIIHRRREDTHNLAVIEVKKMQKKMKRKKTLKRLKL